MTGELHEECGVFGIYDNDGLDAGRQAYMALYALQHRGQESCGIAVNDDGVIFAHKDIGLVHEVFTPRVLENMSGGQIAVGHVRYSTTGSSNRENAQPMVMKHIKGTLALAHNGNIVNAFELREKLELDGAVFRTTNDTEVIAYTIIRKRLKAKSIEQAVSDTMDVIRGAYSIVLTSPRKLIAARDPNGFRPLCMGKIRNSIVFSSESCALDAIGATFIRDVEPGEIVVVDENGMRSLRDHCGGKTSLCIFEFIYFARPDSIIDGASVHQARLRAGAFLAQQHPVDADIVIGVPDSGLDAALGYARESGIPYGIGFVKNRYVGRTFIQPTQGERTTSVRIKLNALRSTVKGKRVVLIDDSIVRGTTSAHIVQLLREAGAKEVHMRISSPPFMNPCYFGTDIDSRQKLIACRLTVDEICREIGADTLGYLAVENLDHLTEGTSCGFCKGCFTGGYPMEVPDEIPKDRFETKINKGRWDLFDNTGDD